MGLTQRHPAPSLCNHSSGDSEYFQWMGPHRLSIVFPLLCHPGLVDDACGPMETLLVLRPQPRGPEKVTPSTTTPLAGLPQFGSDRRLSFPVSRTQGQRFQHLRVSPLHRVQNKNQNSNNNHLDKGWTFSASNTPSSLLQQRLSLLFKLELEVGVFRWSGFHPNHQLC